MARLGNGGKPGGDFCREDGQLTVRNAIEYRHASSGYSQTARPVSIVITA